MESTIIGEGEGTISVSACNKHKMIVIGDSLNVNMLRQW